MCFALAPLIRMVLSLIVALTLAVGIVGPSTGASASVVEAGLSDAGVDPSDPADRVGDEADGADDERPGEPILSGAVASPAAAPRWRPLPPAMERGEPRRAVAEHDRPPRPTPASPRDGVARRA